MEAELDSVHSYSPLPFGLLAPHLNLSEAPAHAAGAGTTLPFWVQVSKRNTPTTIL